MRVAYLTTYDARDPRNWSGTATYMARSFQKLGVDLHLVGNLTRRHRVLLMAREILYARLRGQRYLAERSPVLLESYAREIRKRLSPLDPDVVFSPGSLPIACLNTGRPIVFWTDATFAGLVDYFPNYYGLCRESARDGNRMEQAALDRCSLAVYSSEWAARTALEHYRVSPDKVKVVPFGTNLDCSPSLGEVESAVDRRTLEACRLLLIGGDWMRKGADLALEIAADLNQRGLPTRLTVVGCKSPRESLPPFVTSLGFLDKRTPQGFNRIKQLLACSHFLLAPSRADCTPIVLCEANSFGLPCLASDTGGIGSVIRNGVNGYLFGRSASARPYADSILSLMRDSRRYRELALSSFNEYQTRLNWTTATRIVLGYMQEMLAVQDGCSERKGAAPCFNSLRG